jgi:hypothetical protein
VRQDRNPEHGHTAASAPISAGGGSPPFDDSVALLSGTWGNDQTSQAVIHEVRLASEQPFTK